MYLKKFNLFLISFSLIFTFFFWQVLDLTTVLTPNLDNHHSNLEKYYEKYHALSLDEFLQSSSSIPNYFKTKLDIGYDLICLVFKTFELKFESFLFVSIFITFVAYIKTFSKITSCKYFIIYLLLYLLSSFWMSFTLGATLRQGIAITILFYFLFGKKKFSFKKDFLIIILASTVHLSAIIFIPYLIFEKLFLNRLKLISIIFTFTSILYIFNLNFFISDFIFNLANFLDLDLRALKEYRTNHPITGFSVYKLLATVIPLILFMIALSIGNYKTDNIHKRIYLYCIYPSIIGLLLSQMSYYDRILLYSWTFSPFLIAYFFYRIYPTFVIQFNNFIKRSN